MDLDSLDFQQARIKQVLFKSQLRSVLYGVRSADSAMFSVRNNPLGQWLYQVAVPKYGHMGEVRQIEQQLIELLKVGQELLNRYNRGDIEEARAGLEQIDVYNDRISTLLQQLETAGRKR